MKPQIVNYYGGKVKMWKHIQPLIPPHKLYIEPFLGGGTVFFNKDMAKINIINDLNNALYNMYYVAKLDPIEFMKNIDYYPYSRRVFNDFRNIYLTETDVPNLKHAVATWYVLSCSFAHNNSVLNIYTDNTSDTQKIINYKSRLPDCISRIANAVLENRDAISVVSTYDRPHSFIYLDPPYPNTSKNDYGNGVKYSIEDFTNLLDNLTKTKGKFLLSSYQYPILDEYVRNNGWNTKTITLHKDISSYSKEREKRREVLTWNYDIKDLTLF